jgi:putative NADPH-quinone reductase
MKCLVVTTHPLNNSLCKQLSGYVVDRLIEIGHEVTTEDLYEEGFEPALTVKERDSYYAGSHDFSDIKEQAYRLLGAECLVLLFPTWWFGFPAMLKGWFDRVWAPGVAFDHANDYGPIKPRLENLKRVLVVTTLGSPWWIDRLVMRQPVKRITQLALLGTCAKKSKLQFLSLYNSEELNEQEIMKFKVKIGKAIDSWPK